MYCSTVLLFIFFLNFFILINGQGDGKSFRSSNYIEEEKGLEAYKFLSNRVDTSLIIMIKRKNSSCVEPRIIFRTLNGTNGEFKSIEIPNEHIPDFNFCFKSFESEEGKDLIVKWYAMEAEQLFITYLDSNDINNASYHGLSFYLNGTYIGYVIKLTYK